MNFRYIFAFAANYGWSRTTTQSVYGPLLQMNRNLLVVTHQTHFANTVNPACYYPLTPYLLIYILVIELSLTCVVISSCVQGNFFQNMGSICVFAVFGTIISATIVGGGVYLLGQVSLLLVLLYFTGFRVKNSCYFD